MTTLQELLEIVKKSDVDKATKEMVTTAINSAYDAGFKAGMEAATQVQSAAFDMLHKFSCILTTRREQ
jgi:hypothetical protein